MLQVPPLTPRDDVRHRTRRHPVLRGHCGLVRASGNRLPDRDHFSSGELGVLAAPLVLGCGDSFEMLRIHASAVAAEVINLVARWDLAMSEAVHDAVGDVMVLPAACAVVAVALWRQSANPHPASRTWVDPEPGFRRVSEWMRNFWVMIALHGQRRELFACAPLAQVAAAQPLCVDVEPAFKKRTPVFVSGHKLLVLREGRHGKV